MLWKIRAVGFLCTSSSSLRLIGPVRALATRTMSATNSNNRLLIVDTDVGFDDLVALQCLLNARATAPNPNGSSQQLPLVVTTVGGVVSASRGSHVLKGLFPQVEVSTGKNSPSMPFDPLPDWLHNYRTETLAAFARDRNIHVDSSSSMPDESSDAHEDDESHKISNQNIVKRILEVPDNSSVDILAIGPLTNLSEWLAHCERQNQEDDHSTAERFASKINSIYVLGGNHPSLAHTLKEPEFNFGLDPAAAHHVLTSSLLCDKIHLVTSSVCNMGKLTAAIGNEHMQKFIEEEHTRSIDSSCGFYRSILQYDTVAYSLSCDPVCAYVMKFPESVAWEQVSVRVDAGTGKLEHVVSASKSDENSDTTSDKEKATMIRIASDINLKEYLSWVRTTIHTKRR